MDAPLLLFALFGAFMVYRTLLTGDASAGGGAIMRDDQPGAYWSITAAAILVTCISLFMAFA